MVIIFPSRIYSIHPCYLLHPRYGKYVVPFLVGHPVYLCMRVYLHTRWARIDQDIRQKRIPDHVESKGCHHGQDECRWTSFPNIWQNRLQIGSQLHQMRMHFSSCTVGPAVPVSRSVFDNRTCQWIMQKRQIWRQVRSGYLRTDICFYVEVWLWRHVENMWLDVTDCFTV